MPGWTRRFFFPSVPAFLPAGMSVPGRERGCGRLAAPLLCCILTFAIATAARLLEIPFWDNLAYRLDEEYLLATHDTYHWISGAEGFGRAAGHPMALLARLLAWATGASPANAAFWAPPFFSGLFAVSVFLWAWGLGRPFAGVCAGVLASLSPAFCARTLLGFYDTDLIIVSFAMLLGLVPALWLSPWLSSLPEAVLGLFPKTKARHAGVQSGRMPSSAGPEPVSAGGCLSGRSWIFGAKADTPGLFLYTRAEAEHSMLTWPWLLLLILSGTLGHAMQEWHSLFPYLVRFSALLPLPILLLTGPRGGRSTLLAGSLCHSFPLLLGWPGAIAGLIYAYALMAVRYSPDDRHDPPAAPGLDSDGKPAESLCWRLSPLSPEFRHSLVRGTPVLILLWSLVLYLCVDAQVIEAMQRSFAAYVMRGGDVYPGDGGVIDPVVFPSVTLSIIEVQPISVQALLSYLYPLEVVGLLGLAAFIWRLLANPVFIWLVPLLAICLLSPKMGARMTLFGPPVVMLALCMEGGMLLRSLAKSIFGPGAFRLRQATGADAPEKAPPKNPRTVSPFYKKDCIHGSAFSQVLYLTFCLVCTAVLAKPLVMPIPAYTQGPIISREQAAALSYLHTYSDRNSVVWNWWDWGYAAHHFARRDTIADGAVHGGAALYLPAAVYASQDPRTARQIIKYTATKGNVAGNVFKDLSASEAQRLMRSLADPARPLIDAKGRQYIVVSLELLRLGVWVTRYGSWNFETKEYAGSLMNNLSAGLTFNLDTGIIFPQKDKPDPIYAASINIFEKYGLERTLYNRYGAYHFIFSTQYLSYQKRSDPLSRAVYDFWRAVRPGYAFPATLSDKLVMDEDFFNTMMVQLLVGDPDGPEIAPYFKLVFDNTYARVYEVL